MLRKILPHVSIVLCNMYIVFFLIDRVNSAMQFIDNGITKALLLVLCVISTINSAFLIRDERRRVAAANHRRVAPREAANRRTAAPRPAPSAQYGANARRIFRN